MLASVHVARRVRAKIESMEISARLAAELAVQQILQTPQYGAVLWERVVETTGRTLLKLSYCIVRMGDFLFACGHFRGGNVLLLLDIEDQFLETGSFGWHFSPAPR